MRNLIVIISCAITISSNAQLDTTWKEKPVITLHEFLDIYYAYDYNQPEAIQRQPFFFNHNRHNEFNLNLGLIRIGVEHKKYRANFGLQVGTYPVDNYAAEPPSYKFISEANVGVSLSKKNDIWIDAGIFSSHIGFESAISTENLTLTRSLLAENSPYFLSGVKLTVNPSDKWLISGLVVNGWQRIQRVQGNSLPSFGTQLTYSPNKKFNLNWSTFIGTDDPDSTRRMRYFNNLYAGISPTSKFNMILGVDFGLQQRNKASSSYYYWFSPVLIMQYQFTEKWHTAFRAEYYEDKQNLIITPQNPQPFETFGFSFNVDYLPADPIQLRIETRWLQSTNNVYIKRSSFIYHNVFICASIAINLSQQLSKIK